MQTDKYGLFIMTSERIFLCTHSQTSGYPTLTASIPNALKAFFVVHMGNLRCCRLSMEARIQHRLHWLTVLYRLPAEGHWIDGRRNDHTWCNDHQ